jgi:cobaltochelatase CobS
MQTSSVSEVTTVAKYKAVCPVCFKQIEKGDPIRVWRKMNGKTRWAHANCYTAPPEDEFPEDENHAQPVDGTDAEAREKISKLSDAILALATRLEAAEKAAASRQDRTIEIKHPDGKVVKIDGAVHPVFDEVVELATAREHVFLPGPAGCGKSHLAAQVAEALGLKFGFISCSAGMSESQLLGRMVPAGEGGKFVFLGTQFLDCYENGGVFLFDEIDAADANVLLVINSALANGHLSVPSRHDKPVATRHPDFVCIAAANTFGRGADRQYVGRSQLDESTLDRFRIGTVPMDYDESLERKLCPDGNLYARLANYRERIRANRLERTISTRFIAAAYRAVQRGKSFSYVDEKVFSGWRSDEIAKVRN